jgi:hypothetical protein
MPSMPPSPALALAAVLASAGPAAAQVSVTADAGLLSAYVWRGVSLTNQAVAQPDLYLTVPVAGGAAVMGAWASLDLGRYDGAGELSEGGGVAAPDLTELDLWAEFGHALGPGLRAAAGALPYLYPNAAGHPYAANRTVEIYGMLDAAARPLAPRVAAWYDVDKVEGAYLEAGVSQEVRALPGFPVTLGALAGFSAGQGVNATDAEQVANFARDGLTHLDFSATGALEAGALTIAPALHLYVLNDDFTRLTEPGRRRDVKAWAGVTLTWSRALQPVP